VDDDDWRKALAGDGDAFGRIFDRHKDRIRRHSHGLVASVPDAEDVVAVTFLEAWRNRHRVRVVDGSLLPWLLVTTTNVARNLSRSSRRYAIALSRLPPVTSVEIPGSDLAATRALRGLSLDDQRVITLCVLYDFTTLEAAEALGVAPGTVKSRLSRAKRRLALQLDLSTAS